MDMRGLSHVGNTGLHVEIGAKPNIKCQFSHSVHHTIYIYIAIMLHVLERIGLLVWRDGTSPCIALPASFASRTARPM